MIFLSLITIPQAFYPILKLPAILCVIVCVFSSTTKSHTTHITVQLYSIVNIITDSHHFKKAYYVLGPYIYYLI